MYGIQKFCGIFDELFHLRIPLENEFNFNLQQPCDFFEFLKFHLRFTKLLNYLHLVSGFQISWDVRFDTSYFSEPSCSSLDWNPFCWELSTELGSAVSFVRHCLPRCSFPQGFLEFQLFLIGIRAAWSYGFGEKSWPSLSSVLRERILKHRLR